jgi:hypothetical protein
MSMHYNFVICYITPGCWLSLHRHAGRFGALMRSPLLDHRLSVYCFVVDLLENSAHTVHRLLCLYMGFRNWLLCEYMAVGDWCLMLHSNEHLCIVSLISRLWLIRCHATIFSQIFFKSFLWCIFAQLNIICFTQGTSQFVSVCTLLLSQQHLVKFVCVSSAHQSLPKGRWMLLSVEAVKRENNYNSS